MGRRGKPYCFILVALCQIILTGCPPPVQNGLKQQCPEKRRLTQQLIDEYGLTKQDFLNLRYYYLENGFTLRRKEISREKKVTEEHELLLRKETTLHFIEFQDGLRGEVEDVEDPLIPALGNYLIKIRFENEQGISLTFATTFWRGSYVLHKSLFSYRTKYGGYEYECLDGDNPHFLLICMRSAQYLKIKHRRAPGVNME